VTVNAVVLYCVLRGLGVRAPLAALGRILIPPFGLAYMAKQRRQQG